jgi:hypothetical protein
MELTLLTPSFPFAQRQSLGDKAGAALKPDSEKSYVEQAGDKVKGTL